MVGIVIKEAFGEQKKWDFSEPRLARRPALAVAAANFLDSLSIIAKMPSDEEIKKDRFSRLPPKNGGTRIDVTTGKKEGEVDK